MRFNHSEISFWKFHVKIESAQPDVRTTIQNYRTIGFGQKIITFIEKNLPDLTGGTLSFEIMNSSPPEGKYTAFPSAAQQKPKSTVGIALEPKINRPDNFLKKPDHKTFLPTPQRSRPHQGLSRNIEEAGPIALHSFPYF